MTIISSKSSLTGNRKLDTEPVLVGFDCYPDYGTRLRTWKYELYSETKFGDWSSSVENREGLTLGALVATHLEDGLAKRKLRRRPQTVILCVWNTLEAFIKLDKATEIFSALDLTGDGVVTAPGGKPISCSYYDKHRNKHQVNVVVRDIRILMPMSRPSPSDLPQLTDGMFSQSLVRYFRQVQDASRRLLEDKQNSLGPHTLASLAVSTTIKTWNDEGFDRLEVLGLIRKREGRRHVEYLHPNRELYEAHAKQAFVGGRHEAFFFGQAPESNWVDVDFSSAYATCLATVRTPDWESLRATSDLAEFIDENIEIGFALVEFEFPTVVRFPTLPVRSEDGMVFPRCGKSMASLPEVRLALALGANLTLIHGCIMGGRSRYPFARMSQRVRELRREAIDDFGSGSPQERLIKTVGNCVYGKVAQGVNPKSTYNSRSRQMEPLRPSKLTNPFFAAHITGLQRAVLGEVINVVPSEFSVLNTTTDGFVCNFPEERLNELTGGPLCQLYKQGLTRIAPSEPMLVVKHRQTKMLVVRSSVQAAMEGSKQQPLLGKGGLPIPSHLKTEEKATYFIDTFFSRSFGTAYPTTKQRSFREIIEGGGEITKTTNVKLTFDFDWKRFPSASGTRQFGRYESVWFETRPMESVEQYIHHRTKWNEFYTTSQRPLKTERDLEDFRDFAAVRKSGKFTLPCGKASIEVARRAFLFEHRRQFPNLGGSRNKNLAEWLTAQGLPTSVKTVEAHSRSSAWFEEGCVEATPAVEKFFQAVAQAFPDMKTEHIIAPPW